MKLAAVFSIATGLSLLGMFGAGVLYDAIGPRVVGAIGAFGAAFSLILIALAVKVQSLNNLLWIAYPAATIFGYTNLYDVFAWLWLLPDDQSTVAAMSGAIQCLSDSFCLLAVFLHDSYGIQLPTYFLFTALFSTAAGFIALAFVPGRKENMRIAAAVIAYQAAAEDSSQSYGSIDDEHDSNPPMQRQISPDISSAWDAFDNSLGSVKDACILYTKVHPTIMLLFSFFSMMQYMFSVYPLFNMYLLYTDLVGHAKAVELVNIFGGLYAVMGAACVLTFGAVVDRIGLYKAVAWLGVPTVINCICFSVPRVDVQVIAQVLLSLIANTWFVILPRFCISYGPPQLFGSLQGIFCVILGLGQIILTRVGTWACWSVVMLVHPVNPPPVLHFLLTIDLWCFGTMVGTVSLCWYWWYYPFPKTSQTTMADVHNAWNECVQPMGADTKVAGAKAVADYGSAKAAASSLLTSRQGTTNTCCSCLPICGKPPRIAESPGMP